jgi:hypothetical protein
MPSYHDFDDVVIFSGVMRVGQVDDTTLDGVEPSKAVFCLRQLGPRVWRWSASRSVTSRPNLFIEIGPPSQVDSPAREQVEEV